MKYLYYDLGEQQEGSWAVAHLRGSAANAHRLEFGSRRTGTGTWSSTVAATATASTARRFVTPDESPAAPEADTALVGASA